MRAKPVNPMDLIDAFQGVMGRRERRDSRVCALLDVGVPAALGGVYGWFVRFYTAHTMRFGGCEMDAAKAAETFLDASRAEMFRDREEQFPDDFDLAHILEDFRSHILVAMYKAKAKLAKAKVEPTEQ